MCSSGCHGYRAGPVAGGGRDGREDAVRKAQQRAGLPRFAARRKQGNLSLAPCSSVSFGGNCDSNYRFSRRARNVSISHSN
jgi:hypothetical protein